MVKVLMFGWEWPPYNSGGLGTACYGLTKSMAKKGANITFALPKKINVGDDFLKLIFGDSEVIYSESQLYSAYSSPSYYVSCSNKIMPKKNPSLSRNLMEEVNNYADFAEQIAEIEDFDVIHIHDWLTAKAGIRAKKVSGKPLVMHVHATEFDRTGGNNCNQVVYNIEKLGMQEADIVITVSDFIKRKVVEHYGINSEKIRVVHNGVEFDSYELEKAHALKKDNKIVLFLGRLTLQKGPDYFIYAAKKVLEKIDNVIFVIAGSGDMEKALIEKTAEMGISDQVLFTGFLRGNDLKKAYQMSDVYVMPSVSEPFGITPLESINCQTPVILSKQSGVSEILTHCLKVDFWDIDELANKIISVLNYPELYSCLRENGFREVNKISWDTPAEKCINIYNELVSKKL